MAPGMTKQYLLIGVKGIDVTVASISKVWPATIGVLTIALSFEACSALQAQALHATTSRVFATDVTAQSPALQPIGSTAAVVNGQVISMNDVVALCLRDDRSYIVDQMVQDYVIDRECARRGIVVTDAQIDSDVDALRKSVAPSTLEQVIAMHNSSMDFVRNAFKQKIERNLLVEDQVPRTKIVHCRAIVIRFALPGMPESIAGTKRTEAEAKDLIDRIRVQLTQGKDFGDLADQYSEASPKNPKGDIGMLYSGMHDVDPKTVDAAVSLIKGGIYPTAIEVNNTYLLMQAISTSDDHAQDEESAYTDVFNTYRQQQVEFLSPPFVVGLIKASRITFVLDAEAIARSGKPLPDAAAVVDGHPIPMKDVVAQCLAQDGPEVVDTLVENYLVDQECKRRGIEVSEDQIDQRLDNLRRQIAPHTIDEGLQSHHITLDNLKYDFRQEIERSCLVASQVGATKIVHCRAITIKFAPTDAPPAADAPKRTEAEALVLIKEIQDQLKQGKDFGDLAAQYSEAAPKTDRGDIGLLWAGMNGMDTQVLDAGLALDTGGVTLEPVKLADAYCLVQTVSTSSDHPKSEESDYATALNRYKTQQAPRLEPAAIIDLIKSSKVVYYIHA